MQRPNKLRVITPGDGPATEFYYDGKTMMAFAPAENLVARPLRRQRSMRRLRRRTTPRRSTSPSPTWWSPIRTRISPRGCKVAFYIGQSNVVAGTTTDMVAFANDDVFAQIWIGADDKLPRKLRAVYLDDPADPASRHGSVELETRSQTRSRYVLRDEGRYGDAHRVRAS